MYGPPPPSICPSCDIPIYPGTDHTTDEGCFEALKQFVKLCQDEIEENRMHDFQHPTRDELMTAMLEMEDQFNKLATYSEALVDHIRKLLHAKL